MATAVSTPRLKKTAPGKTVQTRILMPEVTSRSLKALAHLSGRSLPEEAIHGLNDYINRELPRRAGGRPPKAA